MTFQNTTATRKVFELTKRIRAVKGGTSASKTISILIWCIDYAQSTQDQLISIVSESYPHLSGGAMLDFERIMKDRGYWQDKRWVKNPRTTYTFETGSKIEFITVDTFGKAHGPRRDVLFMNECNNLPYNIADQLITRTRKIIWMDWNPTNEFWFDNELLGKRDDIDFITLTYKDNEALDEGTVKEIESRRWRKDWWTVYGLGQLGTIEGRIYEGWEFIDEVPHEARIIRTGLDFGYTTDESAIVDVYELNGAYIFDEILYRKGMSNKQLVDTLLFKENQALVIADSAEPKSIDELRAYGLNILPCTKGPGSVKRGIDFVKWQRISVTNRSVNTIKEYRNYLWLKDKKDGIIRDNEEDPACKNHAMSAIRYALDSLRPNESVTKQKLERIFNRNEATFYSNSTK